MSSWTYVNGTIIVHPLGRTNHEKRYILETVLEHLPKVQGSEKDMDVYIIQKNGHDMFTSHDEFGQKTNNLIDMDGYRTRNGGMQIQCEYILVVNAALRDRTFDETFREFMKWIVRLGKRVKIENVLVEINNGYDKSTIIKDYYVKKDKYLYSNVFGELYENPTWYRGSNEVNWCEYLMWNRAKQSEYPMMLGYKYFDDEENDKEVERRMEYIRPKRNN